MTDNDNQYEVYGSMRQASQVKRAKNRETSRKRLEEAGIEFEVKNDGAHLIVTGNGRTIDFWPGTGKYHVRNSPKKGRGVKGVIALCGKRQPKPCLWTYSAEGIYDEGQLVDVIGGYEGACGYLIDDETVYEIELHKGCPKCGAAILIKKEKTNE